MSGEAPASIQGGIPPGLRSTKSVTVAVSPIQSHRERHVSSVRSRRAAARPVSADRAERRRRRHRNLRCCHAARGQPALAAAAAARYGRDATAVDADLRSALARIEAIGGGSLAGGSAPAGDSGGDPARLPDESTTTPNKQGKSPKGKDRSKHRRRKPTTTDSSPVRSSDGGQESTSAEAPIFVEEELPQGRSR